MRILTLTKREFYLDLTPYSHNWFSREFVGTRGKNFKTIRSWESKGYKADPDIFHALCVIFIFCNGTSYFIFVFFLFFFPLDPLGCTLWQPPGTEPQSDYWTICSCSGIYFFSFIFGHFRLVLTSVSEVTKCKFNFYRLTYCLFSLQIDHVAKLIALPLVCITLIVIFYDVFLFGY